MCHSERTGNVLPSLCAIQRENFRTQFARYVEQVGVERWPRLFHNLRASALTDLAEKYPLPQVCKWLGNSVDVAMRHYVMLRGVDLSEIEIPSSGREATKQAEKIQNGKADQKADHSA